MYLYYLQPCCRVSKNKITSKYDSEIRDFVNHIDWAGAETSRVDGTSFYCPTFYNVSIRKEPAFICLNEDVKKAITYSSEFISDAYKCNLMKEDCNRVEAFAEIRAMMMYNDLDLHTISISYSYEDDIKYEFIRISKYQYGRIPKGYKNIIISFLLTPSQNIRPLDYRDYVYIPSHYDRYFFKYVTKNVTGTGGI